MLHNNRHPQRHARLLLVAAIAAALGGLGLQRAGAAIEIDEPVDDRAVGEFDAGTFQLTALTTDEAEPTTEGKPGAVTLAKIANLKWRTIDTADSLPLPDGSGVSGAGVTTIGRFIFVVGGTTPVASTTATVYSADVIPNTGAFADGWRSEPTLPAVQHSGDAGLTALATGRSNAGVAAYATNANTGNGFVYVVGGLVSPGGAPLISSYATQIGTVVDGRITAWRSGPDFPAIFGPSSDIRWGLATMPVQVVTTTSGRTFIYVVGGERARRGTLGASSRFTDVYSRILYAELDANGEIVVPGTATPGWSTTTFAIPGVGTASDPGLFNGAATTSRLTDANSGQQDVMFIYGGQTRAEGGARFTAQVSKLVIAADGTLTADGSEAGGISNNAVLPGAGRNGHGAVFWRNGVYIVGGQDGAGSPDTVIRTGIIEQDRTLSEFGAGGPNFINNFQGLPTNFENSSIGRNRAGIAITPFSTPESAWVFVIGGQNTAGRYKSIFRGLVGDTTATPVFPPSGVYVSRPHRIVAGTDVEIRELTWRTALNLDTNASDIVVQFRVSTSLGNIQDRPCADPSLPWSQWYTVDGDLESTDFSKPGRNSVAGVDLPANLAQINCFQYSAELRGNRPNDASTLVPTLYGVSITVIIPGGPDLNYPEESAQNPPVRLVQVGNQVRLDITIENKNDFENPTRPLRSGRNGPQTYPDGDFFVDLFLYPPGTSVPSPHPRPPIQTNPTLPNNVLYAKVRYSTMGNEVIPASGVQFTLPSGAWCDAAVGPQCAVKTPAEILAATPGVWNVVVVVDSGPSRATGDATGLSSIGLVRETSGTPGETSAAPNANSPAESNNVYGPFQVVVPAGVLPEPPTATPVTPTPTRDRGACPVTVDTCMFLPVQLKVAR